MAETRSRREGPGSRSRKAKTAEPDEPPAAPRDDRREKPAGAPAAAAAAPVAPPRPEREPRGFDEETNNRYEEIKRGGTYITELQQMTMAQLLKTAKDEAIPKEEYTGLKKQALIFRIPKHRD